MIESYREEFPLLQRFVHLASASKGPIPLRAWEAMRATMQGIVEGPGDATAILADSLGRCRRLGSYLLGCDRDEVALIFNTTHGINAFASGISWRRGDEVLIPDLEYPANVAPWARLRDQGVRLRIVRSVGGQIPVESFLEAMSKSTRVVAVSHVEFGCGFRNDIPALSELCHDRGALLFVDAAQSLGVIDVDVRRMGIDALSSCGYKWLCGPSGTGLLYVRRDLIPELKPRYVGFEGLSPTAFRRRFDGLARAGWRTWTSYPLSKAANRFEFGEQSAVLLAGLAASLGLLLKLGTKWIEGRSRKLVAHLISSLDSADMELLSPREPEKRAGITTFRPRGQGRDMRRLAQDLRSKGVLISPRAGGIRASCHFFNDPEDLDKLIDAVLESSA